MLYDRWRQVAQARGREVALRDLHNGQSWTFAQLLAISDHSAPPPGEIVFPQGSGPEFIFEVLRGWRHGRVVCPLEEADSVPALSPPPQGIVHIKRTSATTGAARYVIFTADQLAADPANIVATMGLRPESPNLGVLSLAHSYGFSNLVLPLLLHGIPLHLVRSPLPEALRNASVGGEKNARDFTLAAVPAMWRVWHEADAILPSVRLGISAGAALPLPLENDVFQKRGLKIHNFLGSTECGGIAYDGTAEPRDDAALAGTRLRNVDISVADGLLEVRGPAVGAGYWPEPREQLVGGVFQTTDLVEIRDGQLLMRGRASDVINLAGRKIAPEEIERALAQHPSVRECLIFDSPRPGRENQIVGLVVAAPPTTPAALQDFLHARLPAWQIPREWRFVDSLAPNARGKVSRAEWRRRFLAGEI